MCVINIASTFLFLIELIRSFLFIPRLLDWGHKSKLHTQEERKV